MIPRIYIDTSVIGGVLDEEFMQHSNRLLSDFFADRLIAVISDITIAEIKQAPEFIQDLLNHPALKKAEIVNLDQEAIELADAYIREEAIGMVHKIDAQHIAMATVQRVDVLTSWNFQHIVKWKRIRAFNAVNLKLGYPHLEIRSPREIYDEE
ncbi:MAG: PIN domain protein [bacterium]|nr:PIN domain protein [bacterium]